MTTPRRPAAKRSSSARETPPWQPLLAFSALLAIVFGLVFFAGDRLPGEHGYYNEYSSLNVYWLFDDSKLAASPVAAPGTASIPFTRKALLMAWP